MQKEYKSINKSVRKKDAMQLLTGKPVYTDDVTNRVGYVNVSLNDVVYYKEDIYLYDKKEDSFFYKLKSKILSIFK